MSSGSFIIIFVASIVLMLVVCVLYYFKIRLLRKFDPFVQMQVSRVSQNILKVSSWTKEFILTHLYKMSTKKVKSILKGAGGHRDVLLERLRGHNQNLSTQRINQNVSPYLKEIPKIDRNRE